MTLYEMLDITLYYQPVQIFYTNAFDQNMPLFKGRVREARHDEEMWDYLMHKVERYEIRNNVLIIFITDENYEYRLEDKEYKECGARWTRDNRPWKYSCEIEVRER